jgi:phospho-N-acetylmuramoyl-pentapeptide-transferase
MIYYLLYPLHTHESLSFLNVLRYVPFRFLMATMTSLLLSFGLYPWFIRRLQRKQIGQVIRAEGPDTHLAKAGTPTMGGALMLLALVLSTVLWADPSNSMVWVVTLITVAYGVVGYIDDTSKIRTRSTGGLSGRYKLLLQFSTAILVCSWLYYGEAGLPSDWLEIRHRLAAPFFAFSKYPVELPPWLYVIFSSFVIVGTSNAVNLTDGLDGLAIGPVMISAGTYAILAYLAGIESAGELSIFAASVVGVGFGFLWYNTYPAQVFMGDVGSLALGGGLGALAVLTKNELLSVILGGIFVVEAVSVILQVGYFRLTGRRIFLMAPIHHHFEKKGWPEPRVIVRFWIIAIMLAVFSLATLKLR